MTEKDWMKLPVDLWTHIGDWETACIIARDSSPPPNADQDDYSYWQHQLDTIAKIKLQMSL